MHDQLFKHQDQLDQANLDTYAKAAGLNAKAFKTCLRGRTTDVVSQDVQSGRDLFVSGTPTFFVGQVQRDGGVKILKRLVGARPLADFQSVLDPLVAGTKSTGL